MKISWLTNKIAIKVSETEFEYSEEEISVNSDPFSLEAQDWNKLKAVMKVGDELWLFSTPKETWKNLCGRAGACIVRDGKIVRSEVSVLN